MYKVGDEVLVKGEIVSVDEEVPYPVEVRVCACSLPLCFTEEELKLATKTYEQGLADAWELARKIGCVKEEGGMCCDVLEAVYGLSYAEDVFAQYTVEEALAKIESYEKEKEIKVGDEVKNITTGNTFWVIAISKENIHGYSSSAEFHDFPLQRFPKNFDVLVKTGRTTDAIELLKQIGE